MQYIAPRSPAWIFIFLFTLCFFTPVQSAEGGLTVLGEAPPPGFDPATGKRIIPNERCLKCHGDAHEKTDTRDDGTAVTIYAEPEKLEASVHGERNCTECHATIDRVPHRETPEVAVGCVECHRETWDEHRNDPEGKYERLGVVMETIESYYDSVHARPNKHDQSETNATCYDCHEAHDIGTLGSHQRAEHRLKNPEVCGECHKKEFKVYRDSLHGKAALDEGNAESAVCSDCHTTHQIYSPDSDKAKLAITKNCGDCHKEAQRTYFDSYH
ncbi:MAG: cytochrome C, partial [Sedimenticola sp.]